MTAHHGPRRGHVHGPEERPQAYPDRAIRCPKRCSSQCSQGQRMQPRKAQGHTQATGWTPPLRKRKGSRAHRATEAVPRDNLGGIGLRSANEISCCSWVCVNASRPGQSAWTHTPPRKRRVLRFFCCDAPVEGEGFVSQRPCARPCASAIEAREPRGDRQRALLPALEQGWSQRHTRRAGTCDGFPARKKFTSPGRIQTSSLSHLLHVVANRLSCWAGQVRRTCTWSSPRRLPWEHLFRATILSIASRGRTMASAGPVGLGSRRIGVAMSRPRRGKEVGGARPDRCESGTGDGIRPGRTGCREMSRPSFSGCLAIGEMSLAFRTRLVGPLLCSAGHEDDDPRRRLAGELGPNHGSLRDAADPEETMCCRQLLGSPCNSPHMELPTAELEPRRWVSSDSPAWGWLSHGPSHQQFSPQKTPPSPTRHSHPGQKYRKPGPRRPNLQRAGYGGNQMTRTGASADMPLCAQPSPTLPPIEVLWRDAHRCASGCMRPWPPVRCGRSREGGWV